MRLHRKPKPRPSTIRLVPHDRAGRPGYDAYVDDRRVAWGASPTAAVETARLSLSIAGAR